MLIASPRLPLQLLLPHATACPAEGGAEQDRESKAQDAQEYPWGGEDKDGDGYKTEGDLFVLQTVKHAHT